MRKVRNIQLELLDADQLRPYFHFVTCCLNSETESKWLAKKLINPKVQDLYWKLNFSKDKGIACFYETWWFFNVFTKSFH